MKRKTHSTADLSQQTHEVAVVSREDIPAIHSVEQEGKIHQLGELRDFQWHETLKEFLPAGTEFSISWACLQKDETLPKHTHPTQSMMIFYQGSGEMSGQKPQAVSEGDVVVVPAGCEHGFIAGQEGLYAFSIQFGPGLYTNPQQPRVLFSKSHTRLEQLRTYNQQHLQKFLERPFFSLLKNAALEDQEKRQIFLNCMDIWVRNINSPLFSRQQAHYDVEHYFFDPIIEALVDWFPYQMQVLDYAEKSIIIYWVLEQASNHYHDIAKAFIPEAIYRRHFSQHLKFDKKNTLFDEESLHNLPHSTYHRLKEIIILSWNTLENMVDRIFELTTQKTGQSNKREQHIV